MNDSFGSLASLSNITEVEIGSVDYLDVPLQWSNARLSCGHAESYV